MGWHPAVGQQCQRDVKARGSALWCCRAEGPALQAARQGACREVQGLLYLTSLSLAFVPSVGNSPPLDAQKLWMPLLEARCPQGRRSGTVLSLPSGWLNPCCGAHQAVRTTAAHQGGWPGHWESFWGLSSLSVLRRTEPTTQDGRQCPGPL